MINSWHTPPKQIHLAAQDIHVWKARLDLPLPHLLPFTEVLSPQERDRAQRFYFERDRHRWTISRGLLRLLLSNYTHIPPQQLRLITNDYGKPALDLPSLDTSLQFNLSHSADLALYVFGWQRSLGIDVEYMRPDLPYDELAQHSFSPTEQTILRQMPQEHKPQAFYNCWTRKEAYIKARGMGLSLPLDLFDVSLLPGQPALLLQSREDAAEVERWSMQELELEPDYAAALVVEGRGWQLRCWQWHMITASRAEP